MFNKIAEEIAARPEQVAATVAMLDDGATVPFIARYRKEVTGGLDDIQLRRLQERLIYLRDLDQRRDAILKSISEQDKLTPELERQIRTADTKTTLEDLYLPINPSVAPAPRSPGKRGCSRWLICCLPSPRDRRNRKPKHSSMTSWVLLMSKRRWMAHVTF